MDDLAQSAAKELAERWTVDNVAASALKEWDHQTLDIMKRMKDMATTTVKAQVDANEVQAIIQAILDKEQDLLNTFAEIDRLEQVINTIKTTYNQVAQSVDAMEKAISASVSTTSFPFRLGRNVESNFQPYFPPPTPVDIFRTSDLFPSPMNT